MIPVSLAEEDLERKLVRERRGGYCFEQNLLLASALEHLGLEVEPMLARVRAGAPPGTVRPRSHLVLRVTDGDGRVWHADVGFGSGTLLEPIPFGPDGAAAHEQSGWSFRVVEEGPELVLQTLADGTWSDVYAFPPQPVPRIDIETSNWWTSTNPQSAFVFGLIAAVHRPDGSRELISDWSGPLELRVSRPAARRSPGRPAMRSRSCWPSASPCRASRSTPTVACSDPPGRFQLIAASARTLGAQSHQEVARRDWAER